MIQHRVDGLVVAFRVPLDPRRLLDLGIAQGQAAVSIGRAVPHQVGGVTFLLASTGATNGYRFRMSNADATILVGDLRLTDTGQRPAKGANDEAPVGYSVEVSLRASYLATHTLDDAMDYTRELASQFGRLRPGLRVPWCEGERVRRVDLAADITGCTFGVDDRDAFVKRARAAVDYRPSRPPGLEPDDPYAHDSRVHWGRRGEVNLTGFTFSPGNPLMCRIYDKRAELRQWDDEDEKAQIEREVWDRAGVTDDDEVWRVEYQIRRETLEEMKVETLDELRRSLDAVWAYCTEKWLRMVVPDTASRRERCDTDSRWTAIQGVTWRERMEPVERVRRKRGGPSWAQVVGTVVAYQAARGTIPTGATPEQLIEVSLEVHRRDLMSMSDEERERYRQRCEVQIARFASVDDEVSHAA